MPEPHVGFIIAAFTVTFTVVGGMTLALLLEYRRLRTDLDRMAARLPAPGGDEESGQRFDGE